MKRSRYLSWIITVFLITMCHGLAGVSAVAADWLQFRGPNCAGVAVDANIPLKWSDETNLGWKLKLPGKGFSSPLVAGDKVLVTCYSDASADASKVLRHLVCVDRKTGHIAWAKAIPSTAAEKKLPGFATAHGFASETPVSDGENVYVLCGNSGVLAFDLQGKQLWRTDVGHENNSMYGSASSLILYKDRVIVTAGDQSAKLLALDKRTGATVWTSPADSLTRCYATPIIVKTPAGADEMIISAPDEVWGLNPDNGDLNWYATTGIDLLSTPTPVAHDGIVFVIGGRRGARAAVRVGGRDDVNKTHVVWQMAGGSYVPSPVYFKGHLYWVDHRGIANCVDAKTGQLVAKERLDGQFYASVLLLNDKLYAVSRFSGTYVLQAAPELKVLAHNQLTDKSDFSASPAVSDGQLFIRSDAYLYCIRSDQPEK